jgi:putative spermidine/putrescine transport system permease protein
LRWLRRIGPAGAFFAYMGAMLVAPTAYLVWSSVSTTTGLSLEHYVTVLTDPFYLRGFRNSFSLSLLTAIEASVAGALMAASFAYYLPFRSRKALLALSNIATNLGGVSLAFAFIALAGTNGMVTIALREVLGINIYPQFDLASFAGLNLVYFYHLTPFAFLIMLPAFRAIRQQWIEAALTLGATRIQFWIYVGIPVLWPSFLAILILTFANAFGTYSIAMALTVGRVNLIPLQIGFLFGEAAFDRELADALAVLMVLTTSVCIVVYRSLSARTARWVET